MIVLICLNVDEITTNLKIIKMKKHAVNAMAHVDKPNASGK